MSRSAAPDSFPGKTAFIAFSFRDTTCLNEHPPHSLPRATAKQVAVVLRECGICQTSIHPSEQVWTCPKCNLVFHAECWQSNLGCASYCCEQSRARAEEENAAPDPKMQQPIVEAIEPLPWSFLLLRRRDALARRRG